MSCSAYIIFPVLLLNMTCFGQDSNLYEKGKNEFLNGNYRTAADDLNVAAKSRTEGDINYLIAMSYLNLKEYKKALPYFTKDISVNKNNYNAYIQKAHCHKMAGNINDALQTLQELISLKSDYYIAYSEKADIYFGQKKYKAAIDDYNKALTINPGSEKSLFNMGFCYLNLKDTTKACEAWKKIEDIDDFKGYEKAEEICKKYNRVKP